MIFLMAAGLVAGGPAIDADYPGGNIIVEGLDGDTVRLRQDPRDTSGWWFYWNFRVRGAAGRTLTFQFTDQDPLGTRGPAVSTDGGLSWRWLGRQRAAGFDYAFAADQDDVRFSYCIPYLEADLRRWLDAHRDHPNLRIETLCATDAGRQAELLRLGQVAGEPRYRILTTARHHCCEAMANYVMEGLLAAVLAETDDGAWFRANVEVMAIPFVDKDGVEAGDQGKNRRPRDHNRDYDGESVHETVRAIRARVPAWSAGKLAVALDLHCPWIRGMWNEHPYFVGPEDPQIAAELARFSSLLSAAGTGEVAYTPADNLAYGQAWNTGSNFAQGWSFVRWARSLPDLKLAMTLEFPYANARELTLTPDHARVFGGALAAALRRYLDGAGPGL